MNPAVTRAPLPSSVPPDGSAWYLNFWPVFIALLMAISIAASLATVVIAYRHADVDVRRIERLGPVDSEGAATPPVREGRDGGGSPR